MGNNYNNRPPRGPKQQKMMKKKRNFFTSLQKPVSSMNAYESSNVADRVFRELVKGYLNPSEDHIYFANTVFTQALCTKAKAYYDKYDFIVKCIDFTMGDAARSGLAPDERQVRISNEYKSLLWVYGFIAYELEALLVDMDTYTHITRLSQQLFVAREYF